MKRTLSPERFETMYNNWINGNRKDFNKQVRNLSKSETLDFIEKWIELDGKADIAIQLLRYAL